MAFVFVKNKEVTWPVTVRVPGDAGTVSTQTFKATFQILDRDRVDELGKQARANQTLAASISETVDTEVDVLVLLEATKGWEGVEDQSKQAIPFSDEMLRALVGVPYVRQAMFEAYTHAAQGRKAKN
ncbi:MAG TPA: phage tail assembly chaperone [Candidatus Omnitrophota bacterium]|nr:phage tail assembly chaperone [Candidatus Omnitrophota bacterium]